MNFNDLEKEVNKLLKNGWKPIGGLTTSVQMGALMFYQAVFKE